MRTPRRGGVAGAAAAVLALVVLVGGVIVWQKSQGRGGPASTATSWPATSAARSAFPTVPGRTNPAKPTGEDDGTGTTATTEPSTTSANTTTTGPLRPEAFPDATTTGVTVSTSELVELGSNRYWELDHDLDGVSFTGMIVVTKPNLTIRNSRVIATEGVAGIWNPKEFPGLVIDQVDIICTGTPPTGAGVAGSNMTVSRSDISGCADGIKAGPGTTIVANYIHDLGFGEGTHNDGVQIGDGAGLEVRGNSIVQVDNGKRQANAAVFVQDTFAPVDGVTIADNYVAGFGFTLRLNGDRITNATISGNVIGPEHLFGPVLIDGGAESAEKGNRAAGNVRPDGSRID